MDQATYPEVVVRFSTYIGRAALFDASLFGLALRGVCLAALVLPRTPVRSYFKPRRAAPFHPSPATPELPLRCPLAGLLSVALVVTRSRFPCLSSYFSETSGRPAVNGLAAL
jgi:hypothetical protein